MSDGGVVLKQLPSTETSAGAQQSAKEQARWSPYNVNEGSDALHKATPSLPFPSILSSPPTRHSTVHLTSLSSPLSRCCCPLRVRLPQNCPGHLWCRLCVGVWRHSHERWIHHTQQDSTQDIPTVSTAQHTHSHTPPHRAYSHAEEGEVAVATLHADLSLSPPRLLSACACGVGMFDAALRVVCWCVALTSV